MSRPESAPQGEKAEAWSDEFFKSATASSDGGEVEKSSTPLTPPAPLPAPEADGGLRAWLQVAGSFLVFSNLWGFTFAFGSFQVWIGDRWTRTIWSHCRDG